MLMVYLQSVIHQVAIVLVGNVYQGEKCCEAPIHAARGEGVRSICISSDSWPLPQHIYQQRQT